ncbi:MAG: divergent polysaccharide deacetylase family protein [Candidatus Omnitrophota bacterium]
MAPLSRGPNIKDVIIGVLLFVIALQGFLLFSTQKKKAPHKKRPAITKPLAAKPKPQKTIGNIVIIIDDWGYSIDRCSHLRKIKSPVTVSILPNLEYSTEIAACAHHNGKEVMLHLPMEPHKFFEQYPKGYLISSNMSKAQVESIISRALDNVPYVSGVNNHMGSRITESKRIMPIVFDALKKKNLFFVDSFVTAKSVCAKIAAEMKMPFAQRNIFLDNENKREYIEGQFAQLAQEAREKGSAIAIGHDRELSLEIIAEQTELLEKQGFKFITVAEYLSLR